MTRLNLLDEIITPELNDLFYVRRSPYTDINPTAIYIGVAQLQIEAVPTP